MNSMEFAIGMELDGERYYAGQAELNKGNALYSVCMMLSDDERNHARILQNKMSEIGSELEDTDTLLKANSIFEGLGSFKSEIKKIPDQLDFFRMALEKEQQSIDLYTDLLSKSKTDSDKQIFEYLICQEKQHYELIDELITLLSRVDEWVESPEFGIRPEY